MQSWSKIACCLHYILSINIKYYYLYNILYYFSTVGQIWIPPMTRVSYSWRKHVFSPAMLTPLVSAKVMYIASSTNRFYWLTRSTSIFEHEERWKYADKWLQSNRACADCRLQGDIKAGSRINVQQRLLWQVTSFTAYSKYRQAPLQVPTRRHSWRHNYRCRQGDTLQTATYSSVEGFVCTYCLKYCRQHFSRNK